MISESWRFTQWWESFTLVSGYLPEIDVLPEAAEKLGLFRRVAAVLNYDDVPHAPRFNHGSD